MVVVVARTFQVPPPRAHAAGRPAEIRLAVLASGSGTILEALLASGLDICVLVADRPCRALEVAAGAGVPTKLVARESFGPSFDRQRYTGQVVGCLGLYRADVIAMAGFGTGTADSAGARHIAANTTHTLLLTGSHHV